MRILTLVLTVAPLTLVLAACANQIFDPSDDRSGTPVKPIDLPPPTSTGGGTPDPGYHAARDYFVKNVYPSLLPTCGPCHAAGQSNGPAFLAGNAEDAYKLIRDYKGSALFALPAKNLLLLKQKHEGPGLTGMQRGIVLEWLQLEYPGERYSEPPITVFDALANFGACLDQGEFVDQGAGKIALSPTDGGCSCATCHSVAEAGLNGAKFVLDPDVFATWSAAQKYPGVLKFVTPLETEDGLFMGLAPSHRIANKGTDPTPQSGGQPNESCSCQTALGLKVNGAINVNDPSYCHPHYVLPPDVEANLDVLIKTTIERANSQVCDGNPPP